jgi:hypothetical protein
MKPENKEKIEDALYEAVSVSRWTENEEALYVVLKPEEIEQSVKYIFENLDKAGYEISRKYVKLPLYGYCKKYSQDLIDILLDQKRYHFFEKFTNVEEYTLIWYPSYTKYDITRYKIEFVSDIDKFLSGIKHREEYKEVICTDGINYEIVE